MANNKESNKVTLEQLKAVPSWLLVAFSAVVAMGLHGGVLSLMKFLMAAHLVSVICAMLGVAISAYGIYRFLTVLRNSGGEEKQEAMD